MKLSTGIALAVRVGIALITCTFFQPDEYFQSLEVAHHLVFGFGHLTWEWLSSTPIRSIVYPGLNVPVYWVLKVLGLDNTRLLIWGPKIIHGVFAAGTDIWLCDLTRKVLGERYVLTALFLSLTSFFHGLSLARSFSNSLETSLTVIALSYFPWHHDENAFKRQEIRRMLIFAALACVIRPTNAIIWVYMFAALLWRLPRKPTYLASVLVDTVCIGSVILGVLVLIDSAYYGALTITAINFLRTNLSSVSLFYGTSPWHYYFSQAMPLLCTTALPFVLHGMLLAARVGTGALQTLSGLIVWTIGIYSLLGHKEWRFIHPILPLMHVLASRSLVPSRRHDKLKSSLPLGRVYRLLLLLNIPAIVYVMLFHGRAQVDVVRYLANLRAGEVSSIGFLMPCHSTPWQAYMHRSDLADEGRIWALGCEPPLSGQDMQFYQDQTDIFFNSPPVYLHTRFPREVNPFFPPSPFPFTAPGASTSSKDWAHEWPQYLVMFGALLDDEVRSILESRRYREVWRSGTGWEGDQRRRGGVKVWSFQPVLD
ncbi:uncharacterized protein FIBRA_02039 [Fibroporia radiculosa]|uniref:Mannosyltransferase n=1 Tax=Fibroporia radiculosa TaxID=599839 RepID=J4G1B5_9APHY|nr:uncharacterized protein FIBRA_02039 [Fibroporia radiculosa]CCM00013.1 predicted protein [Fibroporia radiculosa]